MSRVFGVDKLVQPAGGCGGESREGRFSSPMLLEPIQVSISWKTGTLPEGLKRPEREAHHFHVVPSLIVQGFGGQTEGKRSIRRSKGR